MEEQGDFEPYVLTVLNNAPVHERYGRAYLSAYQIAGSVAHQLAQAGIQLELPIGGLDTGEHRSLAKTIANMLARRRDIDVAVMADLQEVPMTFDYDGTIIHPSSRIVSLFRLRERH